MAIGTPTFATLVRVGGSTTAATTASITPAASDVAVALINWQGNLSSAPTVTMSNGAGWGTLATGWTQMVRGSWAVDGVTGYTAVAEIWACKLGAAPGSGTCTATVSGSPTDTTFALHVFTVSGADVPGSPNGGTVHVTPAGGTNIAITLTNAPASTSLVAGIVGVNDLKAVTQPAGFTESGEVQDSGFGSDFETAWENGSVSQTNTWTIASAAAFGTYAADFELVVAAGGAAVDPSRFAILPPQLLLPALAERLPTPAAGPDPPPLVPPPQDASTIIVAAPPPLLRPTGIPLRFPWPYGGVIAASSDFAAVVNAYLGAVVSSTIGADTTAVVTAPLGPTVTSTTSVDRTTLSTAAIGATTSATTNQAIAAAITAAIGATTVSTTGHDIAGAATAPLGATVAVTISLATDVAIVATATLGGTVRVTTSVDRAATSVAAIGPVTTVTTGADRATTATAPLGATTTATAGVQVTATVVLPTGATATITASMAVPVAATASLGAPATALTSRSVAAAISAAIGATVRAAAVMNGVIVATVITGRRITRRGDLTRVSADAALARITRPADRTRTSRQGDTDRLTRRGEQPRTTGSVE